MPRIEMAASNISSGARSPFALISEAVLASLFAAALLATIAGAQFSGMSFAARLGYAFWHYALPACFFSGVIYWLLWHRSTP